MLDNMHGDVLRARSSAVADVVRDVFNGSLDPIKKVPIECLDVEEVIQYPRGSLKLLGLLRGCDESDLYTV